VVVDSIGTVLVVGSAVSVVGGTVAVVSGLAVVDVVASVVVVEVAVVVLVVVLVATNGFGARQVTSNEGIAPPGRVKLKSCASHKTAALTAARRVDGLPPHSGMAASDGTSSLGGSATAHAKAASLGTSTEAPKAWAAAPTQYDAPSSVESPKPRKISATGKLVAAPLSLESRASCCAASWTHRESSTSATHVVPAAPIGATDRRIAIAANEFSAGSTPVS
jgi:hypothetical protein